MRKTVLLFQIIGFAFFTANAQTGLKLWYNKPATQWVEAWPLCNGKLGAMVFEGVEEELLQLNESTLWSGGPVKTNVNPDAPTYLPQIREVLLREKDYAKANAHIKKMQGLYTESYLPMGDVVIQQIFNGQEPTAYYRDLNLEEATATTQFTINGITYRWEMFTSAPDNVLLVRLAASKRGVLNCKVGAKSQWGYHLSAQATNELLVTGKAPAHIDPS